jgi:hypothetical protein
MALSTMVKQLFNNDVIHMGKSTVSVLYSLKDVTGTILCHAEQLPLSVFVAPCLWLSTLLVLVTKGPSKISRSVFHSKEVKMKRSVRRSMEKFIQRKTHKVYDRVCRWWLSDRIPHEVKGRRYLAQRRRHSVKRNCVNSSHITVFNRNQRRRANLDHNAMQFVVQLQNGGSARHLKRAYGSRHKKGYSTTSAPYQVKSSVYTRRNDVRPCYTSSQLRALTSPLFFCLESSCFF